MGEFLYYEAPAAVSYKSGMRALFRHLGIGAVVELTSRVSVDIPEHLNVSDLPSLDVYVHWYRPDDNDVYLTNVHGGALEDRYLLRRPASYPPTRAFLPGDWYFVTSEWILVSTNRPCVFADWPLPWAIPGLWD